jgi:hypothetical protein
MKKVLLSAALGLLVATSAMAITDGQTYEKVNGLGIQNEWIISRVHTGELQFSALPIANNYARSAVMSNGVIYVARTCAIDITVPGDTALQSAVYKYDATNGDFLGELPLTLNGSPYKNNAASSLQANNIGVDNFGHLWLAPYASAENAYIPLYALDGETGELTLITTFDKGDVVTRVDYIDVMGDITREEAELNVMGAGASSPTIYRWHFDQGDFSDEAEGGFDGDPYMDITAFVPDDVTMWGFAPVVRMVLGEDPDDLDTYYHGELFYVDGFHSAPILYDTTGSMIDSFADIVENKEYDLIPEYGTNGIAEFHIDGRNFVVYSKAQYTGDGHGCQALVCEMGEGMSLTGMQKYWQIPADSLGHMSDGGIRLHALNVEYGYDDQGEEVVTLFTYKCQNGMGVYKIGKNMGGGAPIGNPADVSGDGGVDVTDLNIVINVALDKDTNPKADVSRDGVVDVTDINLVLNAMLQQ